jgi:hypothetical protein
MFSCTISSSIIHCTLCKLSLLTQLLTQLAIVDLLRFLKRTFVVCNCLLVVVVVDYLRVLFVTLLCCCRCQSVTTSLLLCINNISGVDGTANDKDWLKFVGVFIQQLATGGAGR